MTNLKKQAILKLPQRSKTKCNTEHEYCPSPADSPAYVPADSPQTSKTAQTENSPATQLTTTRTTQTEEGSRSLTLTQGRPNTRSEPSNVPSGDRGSGLPPGPLSHTVRSLSTGRDKESYLRTPQPKTWETTKCSENQPAKATATSAVAIAKPTRSTSHHHDVAAYAYSMLWHAFIRSPPGEQRRAKYTYPKNHSTQHHSAYHAEDASAAEPTSHKHGHYAASLNTNNTNPPSSPH